MSAINREDLSINTIVGPGTSVVGDIEAAGFVRVDGSLRGNLHVKGRVVIGEQARMKGDVSGTAITVGGVVVGDILASERITVLSTALVLGDIVTKRITAEEGSLVNGRIVACGNSGDWETVLAEYRDARSVRSTLTERSDG